MYLSAFKNTFCRVDDASLSESSGLVVASKLPNDGRLTCCALLVFSKMTYRQNKKTGKLHCYTVEGQLPAQAPKRCFVTTDPENFHISPHFLPATASTSSVPPPLASLAFGPMAVSVHERFGRQSFVIQSFREWRLKKAAAKTGYPFLHTHPHDNCLLSHRSNCCDVV